MFFLEMFLRFFATFYVDFREGLTGMVCLVSVLSILSCLYLMRAIATVVVMILFGIRYWFSANISLFIKLSKYTDNITCKKIQDVVELTQSQLYILIGSSNKVVCANILSYLPSV